MSRGGEGFTSMWMVFPMPGSAVVVDRLARGRRAFDDLYQPVVSPRAAWRTAPRRRIVQLVRVVDVGPAPSLFACRIPVWTHMADSLAWQGSVFCTVGLQVPVCSPPP